MEKESITIEIKQEVSVTLLWIVAGVILVSATFFLTPQSTELWPAVNAAGIAAAIYLVALLAYVLRRPITARHRLSVGLIALFVMCCTAFVWTRMQDEAEWHAETIMKVRGVIGRNITTWAMPTPLLKTLDAYHHQGVKKSKSLGDKFRELEGGATVGSNIYKPQWEGDDVTIIVETLDPDRVVLVSQETFVKGRDPAFRNYDGKVGMIQEKYILTERGLTHVQKTDSPEFAPGFLWQLVLLTVIVLFFVLFSEKAFKPDRIEVGQNPRIVLFPYMLAGGHTIENGLLAFSGKPAEKANGKFQVVTLAGLLVVSVICPTIFLLQWRRRRLGSPASLELTPWRITHVSLAFVLHWCYTYRLQYCPSS